LVLRIFTKENQGSRSSNLRICLVIFDILIFVNFIYFLFFENYFIYYFKKNYFIFFKTVVYNLCPLYSLINVAGAYSSNIIKVKNKTT